MHRNLKNKENLQSKSENPNIFEIGGHGYPANLNNRFLNLQPTSNDPENLFGLRIWGLRSYFGAKLVKIKEKVRSKSQNSTIFDM